MVVGWRHRALDQVLHLGNVLFGDFDARACGRFEVDGKLPGVRLGKKGQPQQGINAEAGYEQEHQTPHCKGRPP